VRVTGFQELERKGPSALKIRLALDYAEPNDLPRQVCIKGIFDPELSGWLKSGGQHAEVSFYRQFAPRLTVRVPWAPFTGFDPETMAGVILMEDLIDEGASFLTALSPYTPEQAHASLDQLARLHGGTWAAGADSQTWSGPTLDYLVGARVVSAERVVELLGGSRGLRLPDAIKSGERIYAGLGALADQVRALPKCFIHGDAHAGNLWEGPDGIGMVDWQVFQRNHWSIDVAYHIGAVLDVEERRQTEADLLDYYLERLALHGGRPPGLEDAWRQYQVALTYGYYMWAITQRVETPIVDQFVTRLGTAVADHGSLRLLGV
jgi:hypothetical protein